MAANSVQLGLFMKMDNEEPHKNCLYQCQQKTVSLKHLR